MRSLTAAEKFIQGSTELRTQRGSLQQLVATRYDW